MDASGPNKDAQLVVEAFTNIEESTDTIRLFHSDWGHELKNKEIERILKESGIKNLYVWKEDGQINLTNF